MMANVMLLVRMGPMFTVPADATAAQAAAISRNASPVRMLANKQQ